MSTENPAAEITMNQDDTSTDGSTENPRTRGERPTVPVFYQLPAAAVDRAIERFKRRHERDPNPRAATALEAFIYDEIQEEPVMYVEGEPLDEYAGERLETDLSGE